MVQESEPTLLQRLMPGEGPLQLAILLAIPKGQQLPEEDRNLLIKTVEWKEVAVSAASVLVVGIPLTGVRFPTLQRQVQAPRWLAFGLSPLQLGLQVHTPGQAPIVFRGIKMAFSPSLKELRAHDQLKRTFFWQCLKPLMQS